MPGSPLSRADVAELLARLVDRSLVNYEIPGRYGLLKTLRIYALDRLGESPESRGVRERHFAYYCEFCRETEAKIRGPEQVEWLKRYDAEADNLRAALERGTSEPRLWRAAVEMAAELLDYWIIRGYLAEGHARFEQLVRFAQAEETEHRAIALSGLASCLRYRVLPGCLETHGLAIELARAAGSPRTLARVLFSYAYTLHYENRLEEAERVLLELLPSAAATDAFLEGFALMDLGNLAQRRGDLDEAERLYRRALSLRQAQGDVRGIGGAAGALGQIAELRGDLQAAAALHRQCIRALYLVGDALGLPGGLTGGCCALWIEGRLEEGAMLLGCSDRLLEELGTWRDPSEEDAYARWAHRLLEAMGETRFEAAHREGTRLTADEAVKLALNDSGSLKSAPTAGG